MPLSDEARYVLDDRPRLRLTPLAGAVISLSVHAVETDPDRVDLAADLSFADWLHAVDVGAFHIDLGVGELPDDPERPVEVSLTLRAPFAYEFDAGDDLMAELFGDDPSPLHHTEAWLLASALQEVDVPDSDGATTSVGFRTEWARPLGP